MRERIEHPAREGTFYACAVLVVTFREAVGSAVDRRAETTLITRHFTWPGQHVKSTMTALFMPNVTPSLRSGRSLITSTNTVSGSASELLDSTMTMSQSSRSGRECELNFAAGGNVSRVLNWGQESTNTSITPPTTNGASRHWICSNQLNRRTYTLVLQLRWGGPKDTVQIAQRAGREQYAGAVEASFARSEYPAVLFCARCTLSNQRPRVVFDAESVCNACRYAERKNEIDWVKREEQLRELLDKHRSRGSDFDVVVPCSGGKDGGFVAHQLKHKYGMRVLAVTWAPLMYTEIGRRNLDSFIASGFDHVLGTANPKVLAKLARDSFIDMGDPFQPFIYGQTNFPIQVAKSYGVNLIMYGENGEVEYGGDQTLAESPIKEITKASQHYFSGRDVTYWKSRGYTEQELRFLERPEDTGEIEQHFFGFYTKWDPQENYYYATEHLGFQANPDRSEGTYSKYASLDDRFDGFHYYLGFIKFGIGRATSDSAHEIRDGKITRDEGIELVRKFDGEFPTKHFEEFLEYCEMTEADFDKIVDSWRSPHIWRKRGGTWELRSKIWEAN